ncbi:MAG TPA: S-ribosylhomocysteine lyase [Acholeplasmataceae bacterium]|nr:S-ribosylhomocysteine lyase [Acholeplasmataceae bacterium]
MKKIASFEIDHLKLLPGIYVSRKDYLTEDVLTTFDLRFTRPNFEPVMGTGAIHALEHLGASFLRNNPQFKERIIYFGPMGCRTGFYLILNGDLKSKDIVGLISEMIEFVLNFEGQIIGASPVECGNYIDMDLNMAKFYANKYKEEVLKNITEERLNYPN